MERYGLNSVVRKEWPENPKVPPEELTIQRLLAVDWAYDGLAADLEYSFLPALRKAVKAVGATRIPKQIRQDLEAAAKNIYKALREYRRALADPSRSSKVKVTVLPEPGPRALELGEKGEENTVGENLEVKRPAQERGNAKIMSLDEVRLAQMSPRPDRPRPPLKGPKVVALHRRETREELFARKLAEFERLVETDAKEPA